jgi:hypothetical protein
MPANTESADKAFITPMPYECSSQNHKLHALLYTHQAYNSVIL